MQRWSLDQQVFDSLTPKATERCLCSQRNPTTVKLPEKIKGDSNCACETSGSPSCLFSSHHPSPSTPKLPATWTHSKDNNATSQQSSASKTRGPSPTSKPTQTSSYASCRKTSPKSFEAAKSNFYQTNWRLRGKTKERICQS